DVDEHDDQRIDGAHAERPHDREREAEQDAGDHDQHGDLDRHDHALQDGGEITFDHRPFEERVEEVRHGSAQRVSSAMKASVRAWLGAENICCGGPCSTIRPWSMKITRSAASRAKRISWLTTSMVMPPRLRSRMTASTLPTSSGSSAEVGSSNSMIFGSSAAARAIAARCCWPPDSSLGQALALSASPTRSSAAMPMRSASARGLPSTLASASVTLRSAVRCG